MRLHNYCIFKEKELLTYLSSQKGATYENDYIFIDRGSKVLAVCHADTSPLISSYRDFTKFKSVTGQNIVMSPALDDRLGIWLVMEILKDLKMDVLITTGEEIGQSSASKFKTSKTYHWLVEFDRKGSDVVTYDYYNEEMIVGLEAVGFEIGIGSFSDICSLEDLGVAAFNVGIGYHQEHTRGCWASLGETFKQIKKFRKFYYRNHNTKFLNDATGNWWEKDYEWSSPNDEWLYETEKEIGDAATNTVRILRSDEEYLSKFSLGRYRDHYASKYLSRGKKYLKVGLC